MSKVSAQRVEPFAFSRLVEEAKKKDSRGWASVVGKSLGLSDSTIRGYNAQETIPLLLELASRAVLTREGKEGLALYVVEVPCMEEEIFLSHAKFIRASVSKVR